MSDFRKKKKQQKKTFCIISVKWDMRANYVNTVWNGLLQVRFNCVLTSSLYLYISVDLAFVMEIVNTLKWTPKPILPLESIETVTYQYF